MTAKKYRSPALLLALVLLLALASLGMGYGLWSKTLTIDGTVNTGELHAEWTLVGCFDFESKLPEPKDVGTTSGWIDTGDPQLLHFQIDNGYPSYTGDCEGEWTNTGNIPVVIVAVRIDSQIATSGVPVDLDVNADGKPDLNVTFVNSIGDQVDPGEFVAHSIRAHVKQEAPQDSALPFTMAICLRQWNEPATAAECFAAAP